MVRVVAARFPDRTRASAALSALRRHLSLVALDAAIAPLGIPGTRSDSDTLLAGHFHEADTSLVASVVRQQGGEIVVDVDQSWTVPRGWMQEAQQQQAAPDQATTGSGQPVAHHRAGAGGGQEVSMRGLRAHRGRSRQPVAY